ncbi:MAG TPA: rRNA maturation RNase YbeY [Actinomycetes bacterium]|nr:rRNA maturation RNase YbeY [Actinomycetes bacterium]
MTVAVSNESGAAVDEDELAELAQFVLGEMGVDSSVELSVTLVDEPEMSRLHEMYMGEPGPTDVLAFPMDDLADEHEGGADTALLGDVVLCPAIAVTQAEEAGHDTAAELRLLCAHGVLHLLGYDHHEPSDEREMFGLQARLLGQFRNAAAS